MSKVLRKIACGREAVNVYVIPEGEPFIPGEVCFSHDEILWAEKVASGYHASDDRETFWAGILESKRANPRYRVYDSFSCDNAPPPPPVPGKKEDPLRPWTPEDRARIAAGAAGCIAAMKRQSELRSA